MSLGIGLENCLSFIHCQLQTPQSRLGHYQNGVHRPVITLSREAGSGAHVVAEKLLGLMAARETEPEAKWTVFDRNLVAKVLEEHHLPAQFARFMPEDRISETADTMDELFGLHPPSWLLVRHVSETVLRLAEMGNVILIGRGANVITAKLDYAFHVRLVGSLEQRIRHYAEACHLDAKAAAAAVAREDLGRRRFIKKYFQKDIDDPLLYHLCLNTDLMGYDAAANLIAGAVTARTAALASAAAHAA